MPDVSKIKLPDNSELNIKDARIPGVDSTPTSGSSNLVTSGGIYNAIDEISLVTAAALNDLNDRVSDLEDDTGSLQSTINDSTITIQINSSTVDSFTTNASSNKIINLTNIATTGPNNYLCETTGVKGIMAYGGDYYAMPGCGNGTTEDAVLATLDDVPTISTNIASDKANDNKVSGTKATYDEIHPAVVSTQPAGGFAPNILYDLGTITGTVTFTMASPSDATIINHYYWTFETSSTAPTITWPAGITSWYGGSAPTISASKHYEISVLDGVACFMEV